MKKSDIYGLVGSLLSCILLFLILWLVVMPVSGDEKPEDEGIVVSFGDADQGAGDEVTAQPALQQSVVPQEAGTLDENVLTQKDNSVALSTQKKNKDVSKKEQQKKDQQLTDQRKREQNAINNAQNAVNGLFGNSTSSGSGTTSGGGQQGNPLGTGVSGGNSWSLNGRSLTGRLVSPSYDKDVEGKVTVNIKVDAGGNVVGVSIGSPTTISDAETRNAALSAARSTHFTGGDRAVSGVITYNFRLK